MTIMNNRWRDWKSNLKSNNFVPGDRAKSIANTINNDRVNPNQWAALVDYWLTDNAQVVFILIYVLSILTYCYILLLIYKYIQCRI